MGIKKILNLKNKNLPPRSKFNQLNSYFAKWSREHGDGRHFAQSRWKRRRSRPPLALAPVRIQPHTHTVSNFFFFFFFQINMFVFTVVVMNLFVNAGRLRRRSMNGTRAKTPAPQIFTSFFQIVSILSSTILSTKTTFDFSRFGFST